MPNLFKRSEHTSLDPHRNISSLTNISSSLISIFVCTWDFCHISQCMLLISVHLMCTLDFYLIDLWFCLSLFLFSVFSFFLYLICYRLVWVQLVFKHFLTCPSITKLIVHHYNSIIHNILNVVLNKKSPFMFSMLRLHVVDQ